jgi:hypothetical protein
MGIKPRLAGRASRSQVVDGHQPSTGDRKRNKGAPGTAFSGGRLTDWPGALRGRIPLVGITGYLATAN